MQAGRGKKNSNTTGYVYIAFTVGAPTEPAEVIALALEK